MVTSGRKGKRSGREGERESGKKKVKLLFSFPLRG